MREKKGQFSIIAALLMAVVLIAAVIVTYSTIRNFPSQELSKVLSSIDEINLSIKQISEFASGYYGSVLQVTGNATYAKDMTANYVLSGFIYIADSHPNWNPSFDVTQMDFSTLWYEPTSYSMTNISVSYSLSGLGIYGINYETSTSLKVTILETSNNQTRLVVKEGENNTVVTLGISNFLFYNYSYSDSTWKLVPPEGISTVNETYYLDIPSGVDPSSYLIRVINPKGVTVTAFFSTSGRPQYTYTFDWNSTGMESLYSSLTWDTLVIEALQNGTLRWLGQNLQLSMHGKPVPPIPAKAFRVSVNANSTNLEEKQAPFQIEDWGSNYRVPLSLSSSTSIFSNRNMLVFLVNHKVENVTLWWDGQDTATQTSYATQSNFNDKIYDAQEKATLNNGVMSIDILYGNGDFKVETDTSTAKFMRINSESPRFFAAPAFVILNGTVRDIIQQEPEWSGGISENLYVDDFDWTDDQWDRKSGSSPYLDDSNSYIRDDDDLDTEGWFSFQDLSVIGGQLTNVRIQFECRCGGDEYFDFQIDNGTQIFGYYAIDPPSSYGWREYDLSDILDTVEEVNSARLRVRYRFNTGRAYDAYIRRCRLVIECPNIYSQIVLTLPANATYYTYALRTIFVNSNQNRTLTDLSTIQLSISNGQQRTENGTIGGYPISSTGTGPFYNFTDFQEGWAHHWSEFISGNSGAGIMLTDSTNQKLYTFDGIAGEKTGALNVISSGRVIEFNPVERYTACFTHLLDVTWYGAVVTFDGTEPIYNPDDDTGLWVMVEHPPTISVT